MDKVKDFLEKHVQWIALGVGGLVFVWALWAYVLNPSGIGAEVGGQAYGPSEIDNRILTGPAANLRSRMEGAGAPIDVEVNFGGEFVKSFQGNPAQAPAIAEGTVPRSPVPELERIEGGFETVVVDAAPSVPPLELFAIESGRAYANVPTNFAADIEAGVEPEVQAEDIPFVVARYRLPIAELRARFDAVGLSQGTANTSFLEVHLEREKKLEDGSWGERTSIGRLRNYPLPDMPSEEATLEEKAEYLALAKESAADIVQPQFYTVIDGDDPQTLALGEEALDEMEQGGEDAGERPFDPSDPETWPPTNERTPEQNRQIRDYLRQQRNGGNNGGNPADPYGGNPYGGGSNPYGGGSNPYGGGGNPYGGGGNPYGGGNNPYGGGVKGPDAPDLGEGETVYVRQNRNQGNQGGQQTPPPDSPYGANPYGANPYGGSPYGGMYGDPYGGMYGDPYGGMYGGADPYGNYPGGPQQPQRYMAGAVPSEFAPSDHPEDIEGWLYDETAVPGETYRYNIIYSLRNPIFNTQNLAAEDNQELIEQLAITLDPEQEQTWSSGWSDEVMVEPLAKWFMKSVLPDKQTVQFEVFRWQEGQWQRETFKVGPGDTLGGERNGIDYGTGRVVVDIRRTPGRGSEVVVLMDAEGRFSVHTAEDDESEEFRDLEDAIIANAAADAGDTGDAG